MRRAWIILGIVVNLIVPGLGSLMMGKKTVGGIQLGVVVLLWLLGLIGRGLSHVLFWPLSWILSAPFGLAHLLLTPAWLVVWIWALVGGIATLAVDGGSRRPRLP